MGRRLTDPVEMQLIYNVSKDVYDGKYTVAYELCLLKGKVTGTDSSLKMYFNIYSCMRKGKCYKMGTSESFTRFLLTSIYHDFGKEAYINALTAVKGNYTYRESVKNSQPGLVKACKDSITSCGLDIEFENIPISNFIVEKKQVFQTNFKRKTKKIRRLKL